MGLLFNVSELLSVNLGPGLGVKVLDAYGSASYDHTNGERIDLDGYGFDEVWSVDCQVLSDGYWATCELNGKDVSSTVDGYVHLFTNTNDGYFKEVDNAQNCSAVRLQLKISGN